MEQKSLIKPPKSKMLKVGSITLLPGEEVGEHITENKEELILVLKGTATLLKESEVIKLKENETHYIKEDTKHNIKNYSDKILEYIYVVCVFD